MTEIFESVMSVSKTVGIFLLVLSVVIAFHEWGHFLVARLIGVKVLTFSIGFGPKLWRRLVGDTEYCLSAIPLGGYVRLYGDDPSEVVEPKDQAHAFLYQPTLSKLAIVSAGPFFNLLLAYLIFTGMLAIGLPLHVPKFDSLLPVVDTVSADSPAMRAGFKPGDKITSIEGQEVSFWNQLTEVIGANPDTKLEVEVERAGKLVRLFVTPERMQDELPDGQTIEVVRIGIGGAQRQGTTITAEQPIMAIVAGLQATWGWTELTVVSIGKLITGQISPKNIGGPILIGQMSGKAAEQGLLSLLWFVAVISINLGVLNLLPIPVLDGGHILFFLIEAAIRRPLNVKTKEVAQRIGMVLLLLLMVVAFSNDIMRLFTPR